MAKPTKKKMGHLLSVRIDDKLYSIIEKYAKEEHRTVGAMVRHLLSLAVSRKEIYAPPGTDWKALVIEAHEKLTKELSERMKKLEQMKKET